ncbi:hypothetical protein [Actinomadura atramentaria]|uniref:hypothetical protein n=1 Tax=Actinomadura atramentaria TaxID=1990 RepID=UPI00039AEA48|nr:hypothetical protein [Actinomadura atramentaria]
MEDEERVRGAARRRTAGQARPVRGGRPRDRQARSGRRPARRTTSRTADARADARAQRPAEPPREPRDDRAPATRKRPPARPRGGITFGPRMYFAVAGALALIAVVAVLVVVSGGGDEAPRRAAVPRVTNVPQSGGSPASYSSSPSGPAYAGITARSEDAAPLTEAEAFPASAARLDSADGPRLTLRAKRLDADCSAAVWGTGLATELARSGCTQAARTLYSAASPKPGYALAVTVFNLAASADADRLVAGLDAGRGGGFVRPLDGSGGSGGRDRATAAAAGAFGGAFSMARGLAVGHYAVVAWSARLDGSGDESDTALLGLLIEGCKAPGALGRAARAG